MLSDDRELHWIGAIAAPEWLRGLIRAVRREAISPKDARVKQLWDLLRQRQLLGQDRWVKGLLRRCWQGLPARDRPRTTRRLVIAAAAVGRPAVAERSSCRAARPSPAGPRAAAASPCRSSPRGIGQAGRFSAAAPLAHAADRPRSSQVMSRDGLDLLSDVQPAFARPRHASPALASDAVNGGPAGRVRRRDLPLGQRAAEQAAVPGSSTGFSKKSRKVRRSDYVRVARSADLRR